MGLGVGTLLAGLFGMNVRDLWAFLLDLDTDALRILLAYFAVDFTSRRG